MPEPMRFCASLGKCSSAVTLGPPGTVKIAADRAPIDEKRINKILAFLADKLSEDDFAELTDMIDDVVDAAEEENPTKQMAQDGYSASTRRAIRRAHRSLALGFDARPPGRAAGSPRIAQDAGFASRFPDAARIKTDPYEAGDRLAEDRRRQASREGPSAGFFERFPEARRIG